MTQLDLEAAIETNPDDPAAYAVYADWLQAQGDPRGELIALQTAAWRAPGDKKLARLANRHLAAHETTFLGALAGLGAVIVEWHCGFIRALRFRTDATRIDRLLRSILRHPSGRFVQSIVIADTWDTDRDTIVELLAEERRPTTLVELRIGRQWQLERDAAPLRTVFPRLGQGLAPDWRRILSSIRDERRTDLKYDLAALPDLEPRPGVDLAGATTENLARGLKLELEATRDFGLVAAMRHAFSPEALDPFAIALGEQFFAGGTTPTRRWGFDAMGELGDAGAARWIGAQLARWSHPRAVQGIQLLKTIAKRTPIAIAVLFALAKDSRIAPEVRDDVNRVLGDIAAFRETDLATLADSVPALAAPTPANAIARGTRVHWTTDSSTRTGVVFWIGTSKRGGGTRVGITEDGSGETLWANEADCRPA